jgi:hypothetical protein
MLDEDDDMVLVEGKNESLSLNVNYLLFNRSL